MKWIKKVTSTPLTVIAKVIDSLQVQTNERTNAPSIRAVREGLESVAGSVPQVKDSLAESTGDRTNAPSIHATREGLAAVSSGVSANGAKIGTLSDLQTTAKSDLVSAINEVNSGATTGLITVTNQAGETIGSMLNRLVSQVNINKLRASSTLVYKENASNNEYVVMQINFYTNRVQKEAVFSNYRYIYGVGMSSYTADLMSSASSFILVDSSAITNYTDRAISIAGTVEFTLKY